MLKVGKKIKTAIFTIQRNEIIFLPIWLKHHLNYFENQDIYVLAHCSEDSNLDIINHCKINSIKVYNDYTFDHDWLLDTVQSFFSFLLKSYDFVLFCECDELVVFKDMNLQKLILSLKGSPLKCQGLNCIQLPGEEKINWENKLLKQRTKVIPSKLYSKIVMDNKNISWTKGFHDFDVKIKCHPNAFLVHLRDIDYDYSKSRTKSYASQKWKKIDLDSKFGQQNKIKDDLEFKNYYYQNIENAIYIPDWLKEII